MARSGLFVVKVPLNSTNHPSRPRLYHAARPHTAPDDAVSLTQTDRQTDSQTDRQTESSCVNIVLESCQFVYVHLSSLYIHSQTVSESVSLESSPVQCLNNDMRVMISVESDVK